MSSLSNYIERYLKKLIEETEGNHIILKRKQLAERFGCAPSQINYVLATRFRTESGYVVESRRGGGGYIRIYKRTITRPNSDSLTRYLKNGITQEEAFLLIKSLREEGLISAKDARLLRAVANRYNIPVTLPERDLVRGRIIQAMLYVLFELGEENE